jgi:hypothetical protein
VAFPLLLTYEEREKQVREREGTEEKAKETRGMY